MNLPTYANVYREVYGGQLPSPPRPAVVEPERERPDCPNCNHPDGCRVRCEGGMV